METTPISEKHKQLSFEEFLIEEDNAAKLATIPYTDYHLINAKEFTFPKRRFFILSVVAHLVMVAWALTIVVQKMQKTEIVEIDYVAADVAVPAPMNYFPVETAPAPAIEKKATPQDPTEIIKQAPPKPATKQKALAKTNASPKPIKTMTTADSVVNSSRSKTEAVSHVEPMTDISDIEIPTLSEANTSEVPQLSTQEIESDFDKIDEDQDAKLLAAVKDDTKMLEDSTTELDQTTQTIASEDSSGLENAAAEKLQHLNAQKNALKRARQAAGPKGTSKTATAATGVQGGIGSESEGIVRKLEDLRQKPGNPRPSYDVQDRMNGLSGTIIVNAYVTKEGKLTLFRLIQSTGHRNLDRKTLAVLKDWKFYPGQEGWVELPFKWDLKGGVQQKPTLLQRR